MSVASSSSILQNRLEVKYLDPEGRYLDPNCKVESAIVDLPMIPRLSQKVVELVNRSLIYDREYQYGIPVLAGYGTQQQVVSQKESAVKKCQAEVDRYKDNRSNYVCCACILTPLSLFASCVFGVLSLVYPIFFLGVLLFLFPVAVVGVHSARAFFAKRNLNIAQLDKDRFVQQYNKTNIEDLNRSIRFYRGKDCKTLINQFTTEIGGLDQSRYTINDTSHVRRLQLVEARAELLQMREFYDQLCVGGGSQSGGSGEGNVDNPIIATPLSDSAGMVLPEAEVKVIPDASAPPVENRKT